MENSVSSSAFPVVGEGEGPVAVAASTTTANTTSTTTTTSSKKKRAKKKDLASSYTEADMKACLLNWCMCIDPCANVDTIINQYEASSKRKVVKGTLNRHFKKRVNLTMMGCSSCATGTGGGPTTSLREVQELVRRFAFSKARMTAMTPSSNNAASTAAVYYESSQIMLSSLSASDSSIMAAFRDQASAVVEAIFATKRANQTAASIALMKRDGREELLRNEHKRLVAMLDSGQYTFADFLAMERKLNDFKCRLLTMTRGGGDMDDSPMADGDDDSKTLDR